MASESNLTVKVVSPWEIETSSLFFKPSSGFFFVFPDTPPDTRYPHRNEDTSAVKHHHCYLNKSSPLISPALIRYIAAGLKVLLRGS